MTPVSTVCHSFLFPSLHSCLLCCTGAINFSFTGFRRMSKYAGPRQTAFNLTSPQLWLAVAHLRSQAYLCTMALASLPLQSLGALYWLKKMIEEASLSTYVLKVQKLQEHHFGLGPILRHQSSGFSPALPVHQGSKANLDRWCVHSSGATFQLCSSQMWSEG